MTEKKRFLASVLLTFTVCVLVGCSDESKLSQANNDKLVAVGQAGNSADNISLSLYFNSSKEDQPPIMTKELRQINKDEVIGSLIVTELINGPSTSDVIHKIFPNETKLQSFTIKNKIAYISLSPEAKYPMTKANEEATLNSLAYSLTSVNSISKIVLLIDNNNVDTLGGNYDLSVPFGKDSLHILKIK